jgi:hypothetical protein
MVYTIWYIPIAAWYIPSKSGIYHEATFQMGAPGSHSTTDSDMPGIDSEPDSDGLQAWQVAQASLPVHVSPDRDCHHHTS